MKHKVFSIWDFYVSISIFDLHPICLKCFQLWYLAQLITSFLLTCLFTLTFFAFFCSHFIFTCLLRRYDIYSSGRFLCESWLLCVTITSFDFYGVAHLVHPNSMPSPALFKFSTFLSHWPFLLMINSQLWFSRFLYIFLDCFNFNIYFQGEEPICIGTRFYYNENNNSNNNNNNNNNNSDKHFFYRLHYPIAQII